MKWLRSIVREVWGLFVDDGNFAAAIVVWLALAVLVLPRVAAGWAGPVWFVCGAGGDPGRGVLRSRAANEDRPGLELGLQSAALLSELLRAISGTLRGLDSRLLK